MYFGLDGLASVGGDGDGVDVTKHFFTASLNIDKTHSPKIVVYYTFLEILLIFSVRNR